MTHLIKVSKDKWIVRYVEIPMSYSENDARKIAYRAVFNRREKDYNELAHATIVVSHKALRITLEACRIYTNEF